MGLTFFRLVVAVLAMVAVVVDDALVVVVLSLAVAPAVTGLVVLVAVEPVVLQGKTLARAQLMVAGYTAETRQVENPVFRPHHKVRFSKGAAALITFGSEQSDVVLLAVGLAVTDKTRAVLVQKHLAFVALKIGSIKISGCTKSEGKHLEKKLAVIYNADIRFIMRRRYQSQI